MRDVVYIHRFVSLYDTNPAEIIFSKVKHMYRKFNAERPNLDVPSKIDMAIATLTDRDLEGAVDHVRRFVAANY